MAAIDLSIVGEERTDTGKGPSRRARVAGKVPAVLFGRDTDPVHLDLPGHDVFMLVKDHPNAVLNVRYGDNERLALLKSVQRHPVRRDILHVDLQVVRADEKVEVEVPLVLVGETAAGTQVAQEEFVLAVNAPATSIPESIEIDIAGLPEGTAILVKDVVLPEGVEAAVDGERQVLAVHVPREAEEPEAVVEETVEAEAE